MHAYLTWSVLIAQNSCGMRCPILVCANKLRIASDCDEIAVQFQPTFLNFLSSIVNPTFANTFMTLNVILGPIVATWIYCRFVSKH